VTLRLASRLGQALAERACQTEAMQITLVTAGGAAASLGRAVKPPTADVQRLRRQAARLLGSLQARAPVTHLRLSAYPLRPWYVGAHQASLIEAGVAERQTRLEEVIRLIHHRFGIAALKVAALLGPPVPLRVRVSLDAAAQPTRFQLGDEVKVVVGLDGTWREERNWWAKPVRRDYFRLILTDGSLRNIFQDLATDEWFLDRAWPIL
jgi:hypothetical protein